MKVNHYSLGLSQMFDSNPSFDLFQREVHEFAGNLRRGAHLPTPHLKIQQCFTDKNAWSSTNIFTFTLTPESFS